MVPTYEMEFDTTALRILRENLPGYKVVGIECNDIIQASGAIHCITHTIGVNDPLVISHQRLDDTYDDVNPYQVDALMKHRSGISSANLYWTTDTAAGFNIVAMTNSGNDTWTANIPAQAVGASVFYYVEANATSGKTQVRPIVAPTGWWKFKVLDINVGIGESAFGNPEMKPVYPNPASAITCIPLISNEAQNGTLKLVNILGETVEVIHQGDFPKGEQNYFFNAAEHAAGAYLLVWSTNKVNAVQEVVVR